MRGFSLGCGCCACNFKVQVNNVCGGVVSGASVTVTQGGTTVASGTTDGSGGFTASLAHGSYTVAVSATGFCTPSNQNTTQVCPAGTTTTFTIDPNTCLFTITGCCSLALQGATVAVTGGGTGTTNSSGQVTLSIPCSAGFISVSVSKSRFVTQTFSITDTSCSIGKTLLPASGYHCFVGCADPIPDTLHGTDSVAGAFTLTYQTSGPAINCWQGSLSYNYPGCSGGAPCNCGTGSCDHCNAETTTITYKLCGNCANFGSRSLSINYTVTATAVGTSPLNCGAGCTNCYCPGGSGSLFLIPGGSISESSFACPGSFSDVFTLTDSPCLFNSTITITE